MNPLELAANGALLASVLLARKNSVHTWPVGIVGCVLFAFVFFYAKLYADVVLQFFFIVTSIYGWWHWLHGGEQRRVLCVGSVRAPILIGLALAALAVTGAHGWLLHAWTDAQFPFIDSAVLAFSVLAQFLLMARKVETWWFWILVDAIAVPLYYSRDLYLTAAVYALFLLNAIWGLWTWRRLLKT